MDHEFIIAAVGVAATTSATAWTAVKLSLNGMRMGIRRIEQKLDTLDTQTQNNRAAVESIRARCAAFHPEHR